MYICGILLLALGLARELILSRVNLGASLVLFYTRLTAAFTNLKNRTGRAPSFYDGAILQRKTAGTKPMYSRNIMHPRVYENVGPSCTVKQCLWSGL